MLDDDVRWVGNLDAQNLQKSLKTWWKQLNKLGSVPAGADRGQGRTANLSTVPSLHDIYKNSGVLFTQDTSIFHGGCTHIPDY